MDLLDLGHIYKVDFLAIFGQFLGNFLTRQYGHCSKSSSTILLAHFWAIINPIELSPRILTPGMKPIEKRVRKKKGS